MGIIAEPCRIFLLSAKIAAINSFILLNIN